MKNTITRTTLAIALSIFTTAAFATCDVSKIFVGGFNEQTSKEEIGTSLKKVIATLESKGYVVHSNLDSDYGSFKGGVVYKKGYWNDNELNSHKVSIFLDDKYNSSNIKVSNDHILYSGYQLFYEKLSKNAAPLDNLALALSKIPECADIEQKETDFLEGRKSDVSFLKHNRFFEVNEGKTSLLSDSYTNSNKLLTLAKAAVETYGLNELQIIAKGNGRKLKNGLGLSPFGWDILKKEALESAESLNLQSVEICNKLGGTSSNSEKLSAECGESGTFFICLNNQVMTCSIP